MQDLSKTKICWNVIWVQLKSMLEVLCSLLCLPCVGLQSSQVKACTKVLLVNEKTLLEELDRLLVIFLFLMNHSKIIVCVNVCDRLLGSKESDFFMCSIPFSLSPFLM